MNGKSCHHSSRTRDPALDCKPASRMSVNVPECPVCLDTLTAPILQCQGGHSLCSGCSRSLVPPNCPTCRKPMTTMRNWTLEDIIEKVRRRRDLPLN